MDWIARLGLEPHPEGGWYRRIYTDARHYELPAGPRPLASSIHYLLTRAGPLGRMHRNRSTILHYLQHGGPVEYTLLRPDGRLDTVVLGYAPGQTLFLEVPGGVWKASRLLADAAHALVSEAVLPGFDYADHEFLDAARLAAEFPQHCTALLPLLGPVAGT